MEDDLDGFLAELISDDELADLAMAADPNPSIAPDAVPWSPAGSQGPVLLPEWYMPLPRTRRAGRWPAAVASLVIVGFLVIDACGLCITSGFLSWA